MNHQQKWPSTDDDRRWKADFLDQNWSGREDLNLRPLGHDDGIVIAKDAIGKTCDLFSGSLLQILQGTSLDRGPFAGIVTQVLGARWFRLCGDT